MMETGRRPRTEYQSSVRQLLRIDFANLLTTEAFLKYIYIKTGGIPHFYTQESSVLEHKRKWEETKLSAKARN